MPKINRYLALDLGKHTGWALAEGNKIVKSGVFDLSVKASELRGKRGWAFLTFLQRFPEIDEIYYENVQFGGSGYSADHHQFYHGLVMLMEMYAASYGLHPIGIHPSTLKKAFTGYGRAEKHDMCRAAHMIGWPGGKEGTEECDDEADAIGLIATQLWGRYGIPVSF